MTAIIKVLDDMIQEVARLWDFTNPNKRSQAVQEAARNHSVSVSTI